MCIRDRYKAVIDLESIGAGITAFIHLMPVEPQDDVAIPGELLTIPEVRGCHSIAGRASYLIRVQTRTPTELDHLLTRIRTRCNCSTETIVVLDTIFDDLNMVGELSLIHISEPTRRLSRSRMPSSA